MRDEVVFRLSGNPVLGDPVFDVPDPQAVPMTPTQTYLNATVQRRLLGLEARVRQLESRLDAQTWRSRRRRFVEWSRSIWMRLESLWR